MPLSPEQLAKLPKAARSEIARLYANEKDLRQQLTQMTSGEPTAVELEPYRRYDAETKDTRTYMPRETHIRYHFPAPPGARATADDYFIDVQIVPRRADDGDPAELLIRGSHQLSVWHDSSNQFTVRTAAQTPEET